MKSTHARRGPWKCTEMSASLKKKMLRVCPLESVDPREKHVLSFHACLPLALSALPYICAHCVSHPFLALPFRGCTKYLGFVFTLTVFPNQ